MDRPKIHKEKIKSRHVSSAVRLINSYSGKMPLSVFLKKYFSLNRQHGSRDRKEISSLVYNYFRLGNGAEKNLSIEEKTELAEKIVWNSFDSPGKEEVARRLESFKDVFHAENIFRFKSELSKEIDPVLFSLSFLIQPHLFIRIRPGKREKIIDQLAGNKIPFTEFSPTCIALPNGTNVERLSKVNSDVVIQDFNSQQIELFLKTVRQPENPALHVWDCCAASGGKSILAKDIFGKMDLTVSDIRKSILANLKERFHFAEINTYKPLLLDLSQKINSPVPNAPFDLIVADVPCSGSGTWSRTPEELSGFSEKELPAYVSLQRKIIRNILPSLKTGGYLLYITCSVFEKENGENVNYIAENFNLEVVKQSYLKGYENRADTMFAALLRSGQSGY